MSFWFNDVHVVEAIELVADPATSYLKVSFMLS